MKKITIVFVVFAFFASGCALSQPISGNGSSTPTPATIDIQSVVQATLTQVAEQTKVAEQAAVSTAQANEVNSLREELYSLQTQIAAPTPELIPTPLQVVEPTIVSSSPLTSTATWKFNYPDAGKASGEDWAIQGLPTSVDSGDVLQADGIFKNSIGLGSQSWLAEPGTLLVGPDFDKQLVEAAGGAVEYISPINQELIDQSGEFFHLNEDRIDFCSFGSAELEFNGVVVSLEYEEGHSWFLVVRGLFPDGNQDTDRNHTILFSEVVGSHAQCMSYPGNGGGFISEGNFLQVAKLSHGDAGNCGAEGCSGLTVVFVDLNTGAYSIIHQDNTELPWEWVASNWLKP